MSDNASHFGSCRKTGRRQNMNRGDPNAIAEAHGKEWNDPYVALRDLYKIADWDAVTHNRAGICYARIGDYENARHEFLGALSKDDSMADAYCNLGSVLRYMGDLEGAADSYQKALDRDPSHLQASLNLKDVMKDLECLSQSSRMRQAQSSCEAGSMRRASINETLRSVRYAGALVFVVILAIALTLFILRR